MSLFLLVFLIPSNIYPQSYTPNISIHHLLTSSPASLLSLPMYRLWYLVNRESGILVGLDGALQRLLVNGVVYPRLTEAATEQREVGVYLGQPCHPNPCSSGGLCVPFLGNFSCRCPVMFAGKLCQKSMTDILMLKL